MAFDGVSVEIGKWTFESVRNAIQSRGRPLTLSFRDDYLTMEQRAVLTKAVAETEASLPKPRPTVQYRVKPPAAATSSGTRRETALAQNVGNPASSEMVDPVHFRHYSSQRPAQSQAALLGTAQFEHGKSTASYLPGASFPDSHRKSFSDAGASGVLSSAIGPLVAGLMSGISKEGGAEQCAPAMANAPPFTPGYMLRRNSGTADSIERHREFTSGLL